MPQADPSSIAQMFAAALVALTILALGIQSIVKNWKNSAAESSLLTLMHTELERMHEQNSTLSVEIGKLQSELVRLSGQLTSLSRANKELQSEVSRLNDEIARLRATVNKQPAPGRVDI
jgi:peptidoglycan hydrolase CwlO-like protein